MQGAPLDGGAGYGFSRRSFIEKLGAVGGVSLAVAGMEALGFGFASAQAAPPVIAGGKTAKVVVLGAGLAGMTSAYELSRAGYQVEVLEARAFAGGRCQTARKGFVQTEVTGARQVCDLDEGLYFNTGPWRIPYHHTSTLHYTRELGVPLEILVNDNDAAYVMMRGGLGPLADKRLRKGELTTDMRGYTAELLAKTANAGALDASMTHEDRERFIAFLVRDGSLSPKDLSYDGAVDKGLHAQPGRRGYIVKPGAGVDPGPGTPSKPYALGDILSSEAWRGITNAALYEHPTTMFQPRGGMDMIAKAFERRVSKLIRYAAVVQEVRQGDRQVTVSYFDAEEKPAQVTADYCICTIPLSVLNAIPVNVSPRFKAAMQDCSYAPVNKVGLQMKERFWETEHGIYGGHIQTNIPGITVISLPSTGWQGAKGVVLGAYSVVPREAVRLSSLPPSERIRYALDAGEQVFPGAYASSFEKGYVASWHLTKYNLGGWASWSDEGRRQSYPVLCEPDGRIYLAGEHLSYLGGWQAGAIESAWQQIAKLHARVQQA
ncbi:flavin monoamine oxidase family protein [Caulobacter sp. S45]|uniref:flavin monoamine oxidase family protein n=1 Tax=Caulobacter sp. S45 TaxID=1641861 RepID=UPI001575DCF4|nr:flavin monoamine oxidase family protein [Caulobacter sp. S45]